MLSGDLAISNRSVVNSLEFNKIKSPNDELKSFSVVGDHSTSSKFNLEMLLERSRTNKTSGIHDYSLLKKQHDNYA
jgi:hypothetical protein